MGDIFKSLQTSQVLEKMEQIEKDIPLEPGYMKWEARWIKLKCWFKQKNCGCANFIIEEVTHKQIESAAYDRGYTDGYIQLKNEGHK